MNTQNQFVDNKELPNNKIFERNILNATIINNKRIIPDPQDFLLKNKNDEINHNINDRLKPEFFRHTKATLGFINFNENEINKDKFT